MSNAASVAGTLVVMIPTTAGLLVAADSRALVGDRVFDDGFKIVELSRRHPTVVTVTGEGIFVEAPPPDAEVGLYLRGAPRLLDVEGVVQRFLEANPQRLTSDIVQVLAEQCVTAVDRFQEQCPTAVARFAGGLMFTVVVGSYDPDHDRSLMAQVVAGVDASGRRGEVRATTLWEKHAGERRETFLFGDTEYVQRHVLVRREYLRKYRAFVANGRTVHETQVDEAMGAATNLIEATARTTDGAADAPKIGGPIDVVLLGRDPQPRRLRWKPG